MNPSRLASLSLTVPRSCALAMLLVLLLPLQACSTEVRIVELPRGPIGAEEAAACPAKGETKAWVKMNPAGAPREGVTPESVIACDYTPTGQYRQRRTSDAAMIEALQLPFVRDSPPIDEQKPPGVCPAAVFPIDRVVFIFDYGPAGATVIDPPAGDCSLTRREVGNAYTGSEWTPIDCERELILRLHRTRGDVPRHGTEIDATVPVVRVVDAILAHCVEQAT